MAYNNGFPATYQQLYYTPQYQAPALTGQQSAQQPTQSSIIWVQGEAGAKSYLVAPNNTIQLWDSEAPVIYLKSADASGMPSMKILDYTIRDPAPKNPVEAAAGGGSNSVIYATKDDIEMLRDRIETIRTEMEGLTVKRTSTRKEPANE